MNAKEMFSKLGYEKQEDNTIILYSKDYFYSFGFGKVSKSLLFGCEVQTCWFEAREKELKAIIQQMKELGWL